MRILLVNQFYPPDVAPTGQHLHDLARCLVQRGHEVELVCSRRSYDGGGEYAAEEVLDGVRVSRVSAFAFGRRGPGRAADYASFLCAAAGRALAGRRQYDLTLCLTTPPYLGWVMPRALGRRRGTVAQWVMDLYPDVLTAHGSIAAGGLIDRSLRRLTRGQLRHSSLVLALGSRARERVGAHTRGRVAVEAVPLWGPFEGPPEAASVRSWRERRGWRSDDLVFLYSGNMGLGHRLEEFLQAAERRRVESVIWAFAGGGRRRSEVEQFVAAHPESRAELLPYVSRQEVAASLAAADVHLVSLRSPWQGLIVPSKLQAAFGLGRPVIYLGPRDSEPADWVLESGGGWVVEEGDVGGLLRAALEAASADERRKRGEAARAFAQVHFDRETNTRRIAELLERAAGQDDP